MKKNYILDGDNIVRHGNLIEKIAELKNLNFAFYKAKKGKANKAEVQNYSKDLDNNLNILRNEILNGYVENFEYKYFKIYDPKERLICAAPFKQRVLHHAIMNICHEFFEKVQIFDSYASRENKGTYAALDRAKIFNKKYMWYLKLDFKKFFDSIDHGVLKIQLKRLFKDKVLIEIYKKIIDSYSNENNTGVPIGNLTSQYFSNHYLSSLDHYIKEELKVKSYVRYMDDMVLWNNDKKKLLEIGVLLKNYSEKNLKLVLKPICLNRSIKGLPFLGYLLYGSRVLLAKKSKIRFIRKLKLYESKLENKIWNEKEYQEHILPLIAFTKYADALNFRKSILVKTKLVLF